MHLDLPSYLIFFKIFPFLPCINFSLFICYQWCVLFSFLSASKSVNLFPHLLWEEVFTFLLTLAMAHLYISKFHTLEFPNFLSLFSSLPSGFWWFSAFLLVKITNVFLIPGLQFHLTLPLCCLAFETVFTWPYFVLRGCWGTSLVVQGLRLCAANAGDLGLTLGQGTRSQCHNREFACCN